MKNIDRFYELMGRHLTGEISDAERNDLDAWVKADAENQKLFEELTGVWELTEDQASEFQPKAEAAWEKVEARLDDGEAAMPSEAKVRSLPSLIRRLGAVAAAAVLLFVAYNWFGQTGDASSPQPLAFSTKDGEKLELQLPDGSSIWLNENSHISYEEAFAERTVKLEGEAFFDVERMEDSPFEIISGNARTLVLGTSFNLRAYPDEEEVELTVESGQVKFGERQTKKPIFVPAGESAVLNKETKKAKKVRQKIANATSWKSAKISFDETTLSEVVQTLERYFDIDMEVLDKEALKCRMNGNFQSPVLGEILDILKISLAIEIEQKDGVFVISGKGC